MAEASVPEPIEPNISKYSANILQSNSNNNIFFQAIVHMVKKNSTMHIK